MNEMRQYAVFDGNPYVSPMFVILTVFALFLGAVFPPVGVIIFLIAMQFQRRRRKRFRKMRAEAESRDAERRERERIRALMSL